MNKKFLIAGVLAIFILLSICVISAADSNASDDVVKQDDSVKQVDEPVKQDDSVKQDNSVKQADNPAKQKTISVKVRWDGDSSKIPGSVTVKLMRGGSVVDTAVLSPANSWSATFKVTGDGSYSVVEAQNGFTASVSGNANSGFVITNKIASNEVLGAADDAGDNTADGDGQDPNSADDAANDGSDDTNNTNETDDNATDDTPAPIADSTQDNDTGASNTTNTSKKSEPVTKEVVKQKVVKHTKKTPTKVNHKTGIPMVILVVAVMAAAFVPFARKKR